MTSVPSTNGTQSSKPLVPETLDDSLREVISMLSGKKHTATSMENMKVSEEILYAGLVYDRLKKDSPPVAETFRKELRERFDRRTERHDTQPLAKAIRDILSNGVKGRKLSEKLSDTIVSESLGKAQLDRRGSQLSRTARKGGIEEFLSRVGENKAASPKALEKFEKQIEHPSFLLPSIARRQRKELDEIVASLKAPRSPKEPAPEVPPAVPAAVPPAVSPTNGTPETDSPAPLPDPTREVTGPNALVYRPSSDKTGNPLIILPLKYSDDVVGVETLGLSGEILGKLLHSGVGDDGRRYFRSSENVSSWPERVTLLLKFNDNTSLEIPIENSREPFVRSYTNSV